MNYLSTSHPPAPIARALTLAVLLLGLARPSLAQSYGTATGPGLGDRIGKGGTLAEQYSDFNTRLMQIQTVKSLPFFNKTPQQRMSAVRGYYQSVRSGNVRSATSSLASDFSNGGIVKDVGIALMTQVLTQVSQGKSVDESVSKTVRYMLTPEYLIGNLMGGTLGAALGSMIPIPVVGGFLGQLIGGVPTMTGAMLGSNVGSRIVHGIRNGNLDLGEIARSIDWTTLAFQSIGATAGMILGSSLPVPFLGQLVGGVIGGGVGLTAAKWVKKKLGIGQQDQDWIDMPEYDQAQAIDWRTLPPWTRPGAGTSAGTPRSAGTLSAAPSFAPAAPETGLASLEQRAQEVMRRFTDAERAGRKPEAARAFAEYGAVKTRLEQLRTSSAH